MPCSVIRYADGVMQMGEIDVSSGKNFRERGEMMCTYLERLSDE